MFKKKKVVESKKRPSLVVTDNGFSDLKEQFRTIRTNINFTMIDSNLKTLMVTSANRDVGKSFIAINLATIFATENHNVLLVDTDLRKPTIHRTFELSNLKGLTSLLQNPEIKIEDVVYELNMDGLNIITSGPIPPNPSEMLSSKRMTKLINTMKDQYDLVIFDTPPILLVTDTQIMANRVDGTIFVISKGECRKEEVFKSKQMLEMAEGNVIGAIFNRIEKADKNDYYYV